MSAFIIDKDAMDRVVHLMDTEQHWPAHDNDAKGRMLYALNLDAVLQRYPSDNIETAPGPVDIDDIHDNYAFDPPESADPVSCLKSLHCLIYQCAEGSVPDRAVYADLVALCERMDGELCAKHGVAEIYDAPGYDSAP